MFYFFYLAVFLACSVIAHGECCSSESDLQREMEKVKASLQEDVMGVYENSTWNLPYKCCMCKESVRVAWFLIVNEINEKAKNICSILRGLRNQCMSKAKVYQNKLKRALSPGGPYAICKSLKICK